LLRGALSLTRGRVCRLQLLLALARAVIHGSESRGTMTIFYWLRFDTHPTWRVRFPYLYHTGTGWPNYTSRHCVPCSSPPTSRRATVEVFELASTRGSGRLRLVASIYNLGMDSIENTDSKNSSVITSCICCSGKLLIGSLPRNGRPFWFNYSVLQPLCHNIIRANKRIQIRWAVLVSCVAYRTNSYKMLVVVKKKKVKLPLYRPWRPLGLREVEAPTFSDIWHIDGGKVVSPTRRPLFTPRKIPGTHFC
jgi:hypothetical protein